MVVIELGGEIKSTRFMISAHEPPVKHFHVTEMNQWSRAFWVKFLSLWECVEILAVLYFWYILFPYIEEELF